MPATLKQLSDNEIQIFNECEYQQRYTGVRIIDTPGTWLFKDYKSIHKEYLNLYISSKDEAIKLEALKRLIFLNWYWMVEPDYYTGIYDLDKETAIKSYEILNSLIKQNRLDVEFKWMLSVYSCWGDIILDFTENKFHELTSFIESVDSTKRHSPNSFNKTTMEDRGQMGIYWKSIVKKD